MKPGGPITARSIDIARHPRGAALRISRRGGGSHGAALLAALFCAGVIGQAAYERQADAPAAPQMPIVLDAAAVVGVLNSAFTEDGPRYRPRYPMEFDALLGRTSLASFAAAPILSVSNAPALPAPDRARFEEPATRSAAVQVCPGPACRSEWTGRSVRPPARPATLLAQASLPMPPSALLDSPRPISTDSPSMPFSASVAREAMTVLGTRLPEMASSAGRKFVQTATSLSGTIADLVPRL